MPSETAQNAAEDWYSVDLGAFLITPIGWPTHVLTVVASLWLQWDARLPGVRVLSSESVGILIWLWILVVWLIRPLLAAIFWWAIGTPIRPLISEWYQWCVAPLLLVISCFVISTGLPAQVAFKISKSAMEELALKVTKDGKEGPSEWAGVIPFGWAKRIEGGVQLTYAKRRFPWGRTGVYYSWNGAPLSNSHFYSQRHLDGKWYIWHYGGW
jgi:hypothetical protein